MLFSIASDITKRKQLELKSEADLVRFRDIMDNMPNGVVKVYFDKNGSSKPIFINKSFLKMTNMTYEECMKIYGSDIFVGVHPDDLAKVKETFTTISEQTVTETTFRLKKAPNDWIWVRLSSTLKKENNSLFLYNNYQDITEEMNNSSILNSLVSGISGGVAIFAISKHLECRFFSDPFMTLFECSRDELQKLADKNSFFESFVYPLDLSSCLDKIYSLSQKHLPITFTYRSISKKGKIRWLTLNASFLKLENDCPIYCCIFTNPPEETALYQNIVENSESGIFVAEKKTKRILLVNDELCRMFNLPNRSEYIGKNVSSIVLKENILLNSKDISSLKYDCYSVFHCKVNNGKRFYVRAKALDWNGVDSFIMYVSDETEDYERHLLQEKLLNNIPAGIGIYEISDDKTEQVYLSEGFYKLLGYNKESHNQAVKNGFINAVHPDDKKIVADMISHLHTMDSYSVEIRNLSGYGTYIWVRIIAKVIKRDDNKITVYCVYENISEIVDNRLKMKEANIAIKRQYDEELAQRKILERDCMAILKINLSLNKLIDFHTIKENSFFYKQGISIEELLSTMLTHIPNENDRANISNFLNAKLILSHYKKGIVESFIEFQSRQINGCLCWIRVVGRISVDPYTKELIIWAYIKDIDLEKKRIILSSKIIDDEVDFVLVFSVLTKQIVLSKIIKNCKDKKEMFSDESLNYLTLCSNEALKQINKSDKNNVANFLKFENIVESLKMNPELQISYQIINEEGALRRKKMRVFYLDENCEDIVFIRKDITDIYDEEQEQKRILQQALDDAQSANKAKSEFLSRMSHDIRTPMNAIINLTNLSLEELDDKESLRNDLKKISTSSNFLLSLINDILDMSRIESGKMKLSPSVYCFNDFVDYMNSTFSSIAKSNQINFVWKETTLKVDLFVDITRFNQIFYNLISNAIKYTPKGGEVVFEIKNRGVKDGVSSFQISVSDNGIGMSESFQKKMFQPFERADNTSTYVGTGLGLAITKQIVDLMHGQIEVQSELGKGTTVDVFLDLPIATKEQIEEDQLKQQNTKPLHNQINHRNQIILVVEDHPLNLEIITRLLTKEGYTVACAKNGEEALSIYSQSKINHFDAILMDIRMPIMDGLQATKAIRALDRKDAKVIPIIAMTANAFEDDIKTSIKAGMNAHLAKPLEPQKLFNTLEQQMKNSQK